MKKSTKVLLGIATFWPFIYIPLFVLAAFSIFLFPNTGGAPGDGFPLVLMVIFPLHMLTVLSSIALTVFYAVNVFRNKRVEQDKQVLWVLLLMLAGMMAAPVYWYLYIWKDEPQETQSAAPKALHDAEAASWSEAAGMNQQDKDFASPRQPYSWRD